MAGLSRTHVRYGFGALLVVTALLAGVALANGPSKPVPAYDEQATLPFQERPQVAPPRENVTVVTGDAYRRDSGHLVAFAPDGRVLYYNETLSGYLDVEPVPGTASTVVYVGEEPVDDTVACESPVDECTRSVVDRVNLTTGEVTRLYSRVIPQNAQANWYDVDVLGPHRLLVADVFTERVYVVNTTAGVTTWGWSPQAEFSIRRGGPYPTDWAYINDVERLPDGRVMASLRNLDRVVFVDPQRGYRPTWTLGVTDGERRLDEPYDPDYIPEANGGPAVLVADSKHDRIVEYARTSNGWEQTWTWQDETLQLPRDADRLPNGHTLVGDARGHRVLEVDREGRVVWTVPFWSVKDAERLGTGDGSTGGPSARAADLASRTAPDEDGDDASATGPVRTAVGLVRAALPAPVVGAVVATVPPWLSLYGLVATAATVGTALSWAALEAYWRTDRTLRFRWPVRFR